MAKKDTIPQKSSTGHLYSPADGKRYNVPRTFSASPKANPYNRGSGIDLSTGVYRPNLKGGVIGSGGTDKDAAKHGGADVAKKFPISLKHATRPRGRN